MDVSHILDKLNDDQRNAVTSEKQHLLVLAGAGSGKTRFWFTKVHGKVEAIGLILQLLWQLHLQIKLRTKCVLE